VSLDEQPGVLAEAGGKLTTEMRFKVFCSGVDEVAVRVVCELRHCFVPDVSRQSSGLIFKAF
jgi:hypothetical protein